MHARPPTASVLKIIVILILRNETNHLVLSEKRRLGRRQDTLLSAPVTMPLGLLVGVSTDKRTQSARPRCCVSVLSTSHSCSYCMLTVVSWHAHTTTRLELQVCLQVPPSHDLTIKRAYGNKAYILVYNQKRGDFDVSKFSQWLTICGWGRGP